MQFINEQNNLAVLVDFFDYLVQPIFEFSTVLGASNQCAHVEHHDPLCPHFEWHLSRDDSFRKALGNGGFTNTRFANQNRVVLRPPRQDLD